MHLSLSNVNNRNTGISVSPCLLHSLQVAEALWPLFDLYIVIYERVLELKIKGINWTKMAYLVSLISCQCLCAIFWPFQYDSSGFPEHFPCFISCYICPQKVGHFSSNSFLCNVNNAVSIKSESRTKDCGPRTGYKKEIKVSGGLRTTGWV